MNEINCVQAEKHYLGPILPNLGKTRIILKNWTVPLFLRSPNFSQKSEKTTEVLM